LILSALGVPRESKSQTAQCESVAKSDLDNFKLFKNGTEVVNDFTPRKKIVLTPFHILI